MDALLHAVALVAPAADHSNPPSTQTSAFASNSDSPNMRSSPRQLHNTQSQFGHFPHHSDVPSKQRFVLPGINALISGIPPQKEFDAYTTPHTDSNIDHPPNPFHYEYASDPYPKHNMKSLPPLASILSTPTTTNASLGPQLHAQSFGVHHGVPATQGFHASGMARQQFMQTAYAYTQQPQHVYAAGYQHQYPPSTTTMYHHQYTHQQHQYPPY